MHELHSPEVLHEVSPELFQYTCQIIVNLDSYKTLPMSQIQPVVGIRDSSSLETFLLLAVNDECFKICSGLEREIASKDVLNY